MFSLVSSFYSFQDPGPWVLPPVRIHVSTSANLLCKTPPRHAHTLFSWVIPGCAKSAINANHSRIIYFFVDMLILEVTNKHIHIFHFQCLGSPVFDTNRLPILAWVLQPSVGNKVDRVSLDPRMRGVGVFQQFVS